MRETGILRVFDGIMQKSGSQGDGIKTHIREDMGDFKRCVRYGSPELRS